MKIFNSNYIMMACEAAFVQSEWHPVIGDYVWVNEGLHMCVAQVVKTDPIQKNFHGRITLENTETGELLMPLKASCKWLPTVKQILQSLPQDADKDALRIIFKLNHFREEHFKSHSDAMSMEEFLLRYKAYSRYDKWWESDKWKDR